MVFHGEKKVKKGRRKIFPQQNYGKFELMKYHCFKKVLIIFFSDKEGKERPHSIFSTGDLLLYTFF